MSVANPQEIRSRLFMTAVALARLKLNRGTAGNVSARAGEGFLITPSGVPVDRMAPHDMVEATLDGRFSGALVPSSEWRLHRDIYVHRPEIGAVIHAHAPFCTAVACHRMGIPAFHYMVAVAGGKDIRCADYATFGTQDLSDATLRALEGRRACLLAHHGLVACGADLDSALKLAEEVEELAEQYWRVRLLGEPILLDDDEMDRVLARFSTYGQPHRA